MLFMFNALGFKADYKQVHKPMDKHQHTKTHSAKTESLQ